MAKYYAVLNAVGGMMCHLSMMTYAMIAVLNLSLMKTKKTKITRAMRAAWGRKGGKKMSRKKLLAIRRNGRKGGRPRKQPVEGTP